MVDGRRRRQLCLTTRYSPVRECNIRTRRSAAIKYLIYQNSVGKRINRLGWGRFRKTQAVKTSHSLSSVHCCSPSFPNSSFLSAILNNLTIAAESPSNKCGGSFCFLSFYFFFASLLPLLGGEVSHCSIRISSSLHQLQPLFH